MPHGVAWHRGNLTRHGVAWHRVNLTGTTTISLRWGGGGGKPSIQFGSIRHLPISSKRKGLPTQLMKIKRVHIFMVYLPPLSVGTVWSCDYRQLCQTRPRTRIRVTVALFLFMFDRRKSPERLGIGIAIELRCFPPPRSLRFSTSNWTDYPATL